MILWLLTVFLSLRATTWAAEIPKAGADIDAILYYEPLTQTNTRVTREADSAHLHLAAFNRTFTAKLLPSREVFHPEARFMYLGQPIQALTFYKGKLNGEPHSSVKGHLINGVFDGIITSQGVEYHLEAAHKFFENPSFHSLMYRAHDVTSPSGGCGAKGKLMEKLSRIQSTARPTRDKPGRYGNDRHTRASTVNGNRFCQMLIAADHLFVDNIGGGSASAAMAEMVTILTQVQEIFRVTDFDSDGTADGIVPLIARIEVLDRNDPSYNFGTPTITVNEYLDRWSQINHEEFCLALLFTYRDFANGVLGLAWVAQATGGNSGGICEDRVTLNVGPRFLNTAIVTMQNFGRRQPRSVTVITTAHEIGHNFGSPHDPSTTECAPGFSAGGNFLMFPQATDGAQSNNNDFSPCSRRSILPVLQSSGSSCFDATGTFCGNGVMEDGEQCDCGDTCATDPCCTTNCTLTVGSVCSSSQICCNESCQLRGNDTECREETECGTSVNCTGMAATCGPPDERDGQTELCNDGNNFCERGVCSGSACVRAGLTDCQCTEVESQRCDVCCVLDRVCQSSFSSAVMTRLGIAGQRRGSGRSCNNLTGYCDSAGVCQVVDNERTLNDLLDLFTLDTLNNIVAWLSTYWYIPVGVIVGIAILIILLQVTYRRRKPIKRRFSQARHSLRHRGGAQIGGGAPGGGERDNRPPPQRNISPREALTRLSHFFPTADRAVIQSVVDSARSESKAVKKLLKNGYPMRRVPIPRA